MFLKKNLKIAKTIFKKRAKLENLKFPVSKFKFKAMIIKIVWFQKDRYGPMAKNQEFRNEFYIYGQLTFEDGAKVI